MKIFSTAFLLALLPISLCLYPMERTPKKQKLMNNKPLSLKFITALSLAKNGYLNAQTILPDELNNFVLDIKIIAKYDRTEWLKAAVRLRNNDILSDILNTYEYAINQDAKDHAIMTALYDDKLEAAETLIHAGGLVHLGENCTNNCDTRLMHSFVDVLRNTLQNNRPDLVKLLLTNVHSTIDKKIRNYALIWAAAYRNPVEIIELLLELGADIDCCNDFGTTPLIYASGAGSIEVVKFLLSKGANAQLTNSFDETALIRAQKRNQKEIIDLLSTMNVH